MIGNYAWGAAAWASMHNCLQRGIINGLAYALMVFAIEHIRPLRERLIAHVEVPTQLPLIAPWSRILNRVLCRNTKLNGQDYAVILDNLNEADVIEHPYQRLDLTQYANQLARACSVTLCINFLIISPHSPNICHRQFGLENVNPTSMPELPVIQIPISNKGAKKRINIDEDVRFQPYKDAWNGRVPLRGQLLAPWEQPLWQPMEETPPPSPPPPSPPLPPPCAEAMDDVEGSSLHLDDVEGSAEAVESGGTFGAHLGESQKRKRIMSLVDYADSDDDVSDSDEDRPQPPLSVSVRQTNNPSNVVTEDITKLFVKRHGESRNPEM